MSKNNDITAEENPLATLSPDGGMTAIFPTIGFIGDSLSSGEMQIVDPDDPSRSIYLDYYDYSWGKFIERKCGITARIFARGGLTAKTFDRHSWSTMTFAQANACNAYVIALGVNDMVRLNEYECGFGTDADIDPDDPNNNKDSFVGWYDKIIRNLRGNVPDCPIFMLTMPREDRESSPEKRDEHAAFLHRLTKRYKYLYVIDLRKYAPLYDEEFRRKYYLNGHMNPMGYKLTADMVATYIDYIVMHNVDDFRYAALVGRRNTRF